MNKEQMKSLLLRDKEFLKSLYESNSSSKTKNVLSFASDQKLNTLLKFIHLVANGEIKVKKEHFESLTSRHLLTIRKHIESKSSLKKILNGERQVKLQILNKLSPVLHYILYTLFNRILQ